MAAKIIVPSDTKEFGNISMASTIDAGRGMHFILVGAGGNGARLVPPLMQILNPHDHLSIVDHDLVEDRNLGRQHFSPSDIGRYKALVLAERYRRSLGGQPIGISAHTTQLTEEDASATASSLARDSHAATVLIGCVDNAAARRAILKAAQATMSNHTPSVAWVDVGNAFKDGQVILSLLNWPVALKTDGVLVSSSVSVNMRGMELAMPQLLVSRAEDVEEPSCRDRVDLQSVMINVQAASAALNVLSWLKLRTPIMSAGSFFTSACSMQPIKLQGWSRGNMEVVPDQSFAAQD